MKTDALFYQLFQEFPYIFFELIGKSNTPRDAYQFVAPEIKQRSFRLDGIFIPTEELIDYPLYFVEVQFYKEEEFYDRLFPSIFLYFGQYRPLNLNWYAIVIFDSRTNDPKIPSRYQGLVTQNLQRIYLDEIGTVTELSMGLGILKLIVETPQASSDVARTLLERAKNEIEDLVTQKQVIELIEAIVIHKFPQLSRQEIQAMLRLEDIKQTRFYQETFEEGLEQGLEQGKLEQKLAMIPLLAQRGFSLDEIVELIQLDRETVTQVLQQRPN